MRFLNETMTPEEVRAELEKRGVEDLETSFTRDGVTARAILGALRGPEGRACTKYVHAKTWTEAMDELIAGIESMLSTSIVIRARDGRVVGIYPRTDAGRRLAASHSRALGQDSLVAR